MSSRPIERRKPVFAKLVSIRDLGGGGAGIHPLAVIRWLTLPAARGLIYMRFQITSVDQSA